MLLTSNQLAHPTKDQKNNHRKSKSNENIISPVRPVKYQHGNDVIKSSSEMGIG